MLCVCYILLPHITTEATRVTYHTYCGILSIFILPRHIGLLNDALAFQRIPLTPVRHASTLCVNYSERSTGPFAALLYRAQSTCLKSLKSPYNINGLVNCSNSLFYHFTALHTEIYATLKHIYQMCHLLGKSRTKNQEVSVYILKLWDLKNGLTSHKKEKQLGQYLDRTENCMEIQ